VDEQADRERLRLGLWPSLVSKARIDRRQMLEVVLFVLRVRSDATTEFVDVNPETEKPKERTWVPKGSRGNLHKMRGPAPFRALLQHEFQVRAEGEKLLVAGL
jgi:hypothetical protein